MRNGTRVNILRQELAPSLAAILPSFIFFNEGTITKTVKDRVQVRFNGVEPLWFDRSAIQRAVKAVSDQLPEYCPDCLAEDLFVRNCKRHV
jgi:hypothetical protein